MLSVLLRRLLLPGMLMWLLRHALAIWRHLMVRDLDPLSSCRHWWRGSLLGVLPLGDLRCAATGLAGLQAQRRAEHLACTGSLPVLKLILVGLGKAGALLGSIGRLGSICLQPRVGHITSGGCIRGRVWAGPIIRDGGFMVQVLLAVQTLLEGPRGRLCMLGPRRHRGLGLGAKALLSWLALTLLHVLGCRGLRVACRSCH